MSTQIQYQVGNFHKFVATRSFALGSTGINIQEGVELEFDGSQVNYVGYPMFVLPTLRGAIRMGWLIPSEEYDPNNLYVQKPVSAGVQLREAVGGNPMQPQASRVPVMTVDAEESEVALVETHAKSTRDRNSRNYRRDDNHPDVQVESQDGIPVRTLKTPARQGTSLEGSSFGAAIAAAEKVKIEAGQGRTREEILAQMPAEERDQYMAEIQARRSAYVSEEPVVVGQISKTSSSVRETEGVKLRSSVGGGTGIFDPSTGGDQPVRRDVIESEGVRFTTTNGPKRDGGAVKQASKVPAKQDSDTNRQIAKAICSDFPSEYRFTASVQDKIDLISLNYGDRLDVIRAIAAADPDPEIRAYLVQEYPEAFSS